MSLIRLVLDRQGRLASVRFARWYAVRIACAPFLVRTALAVGYVLLVATSSSAQITASGAFGIVKGVEEEAIEEFGGTKFEASRAWSGSAGYRFGDGLTIEFNVQRLRMQLSELEEDFGLLEFTPLVGLLKYQGRPASGRGFSGHAEVGGGVGHRPSFTKGPAVLALERQFRPAALDVQLESRPWVLQFGGGADYFILPRVAVVSEFRFVIARIDSIWDATAPGVRVPITEGVVDGFNGQMLVGLRVFAR